MKTYRIPLEEIKTLVDGVSNLQTQIIINNLIKNNATLDGDYAVLTEQDYSVMLKSFLLGAVSKCPTILGFCAQEGSLFKSAVVSESKEQKDLKDSSTDFQVAIQADAVKDFDKLYLIETDKTDVLIELVNNIRNTNKSLVPAFLADTSIVSNSQYRILDCDAIVDWFDTHLDDAIIYAPGTLWFFKHLGEAFHKYPTLKQSKVLQRLMSILVKTITKAE